MSSGKGLTLVKTTLLSGQDSGAGGSGGFSANQIQAVTSRRTFLYGAHQRSTLDTPPPPSSAHAHKGCINTNTNMLIHGAPPPPPSPSDYATCHGCGPVDVTLTLSPSTHTHLLESERFLRKNIASIQRNVCLHVDFNMDVVNSLCSNNGPCRKMQINWHGTSRSPERKIWPQQKKCWVCPEKHWRLFA